MWQRGRQKKTEMTDGGKRRQRDREGGVCVWQGSKQEVGGRGKGCPPPVPPPSPMVGYACCCCHVAVCPHPSRQTKIENQGKLGHTAKVCRHALSSGLSRVLSGSGLPTDKNEREKHIHTVVIQKKEHIH